ncbi:MAG: hypothetical protein CME71_04880 [Halobacteriovorax sp.]|nr:hypothetical protein [Halobacteriovorax sp.]
MSESRSDFLKSELIKRELESTPWEALTTLAKNKLLLELLAVDRGELEARCINSIGSFDRNDVKASASALADHTIVSSTTADVLAHAKTALSEEYDKIPLEDLETLYTIFSGGAKNKYDSGSDDVLGFIIDLDEEN